MKVSKEGDEAFYVNVIKLILYALSRKSFPQDVKSKVIENLESFLYHISHQLFHSKEFSRNKKIIQQEIQVSTYVYNCVLHSYIYEYVFSIGTERFNWSVCSVLLCCGGMWLQVLLLRDYQDLLR